MGEALVICLSVLFVRFHFLSPLLFVRDFCFFETPFTKGLKGLKKNGATVVNVLPRSQRARDMLPRSRGGANCDVGPSQKTECRD